MTQRNDTPMRILVTGAAGFLGSHLCDRLLREGHQVTGLDNLVSGRMANLEDAVRNPRFEFVFHDVIEPFDGRFDRIYNLACPASPPHYQKDPVATAKTSFMGVLNLLELATRTGARFFHASTSEVYGDPLEHPQRESYHGNVNPVGPRACYDEGKRVAETLAFDFARMQGTPVRVVRIFNTYGPRMRWDDGRVVSNFIWQALRGEDLTVYGDGSQTRSFCYVDDLISGFLLLMEHDTATGPVNLGNPGEFTVGDLADRVIAMTGTRSRIVHRPLPEDDPRRRRPDITLARDLLGWAPRIPLDEGLKPTVAYFRSLLERQQA